jgi:regulator of sirC expression with transglutaminase-like and TPR domain
LLDRSDDELDPLEVKLAFDSLVDPALDREAARAEVAALTQEARRLAGSSSTAVGAIAAVRRVLYESGPWNGCRPFAYDQSDPEGRHLPNALLANYLATRLGQCVSMPILFLILCGKLGLDVALATAPAHLFVRHRLEDGRVANIETTSGGHPARLEWFRQCFPMTDLALESGLYMRSLGRREAAVAMAGVVLTHLSREARYAEAAALAEVLLLHSPRDLTAMLTLASACAGLQQSEFAIYPSPLLIPPELQPRYLTLAETNRTLFAAAEAMGWEEPR